MVSMVVPIADFIPCTMENSNNPGTKIGPALRPREPEKNPAIIPTITITITFIIYLKFIKKFKKRKKIKFFK